MKTQILRTLVLATIVLGFCLPVPASSYVIIVNRKYDSEVITQQELRDIYSGDKTFWNSGARVRPVRLADSDPVTQDFMSEILAQSVSQYLQSWRHKLFSGRALPPKKVDSAQDVVKFVEENDGAIGFVPTASIAKSPTIKAISIH